MNERTTMTLSVCLALSCAWGTPSAVAQVEPSDPERLTSEERALLERGRLVKRQRAQTVGGVRLYGGMSFQRVRATPDVVWQAILDTSGYPRALPQVTEARLLHQEGSKRLVHFRHGQGLLSLQYDLVMHCASESRSVQFHVDQTRPRSLCQGRGSLVVRPHGTGQSMIVFTVFADLGGGMISGILRPQIQDGLLRVPYSLKRYVEGGGRVGLGVTPD